MKAVEFWKELLDELEKGEDVIFVEIIGRTGSAPNIPGAKMFVTHEIAVGTVGGGLSEYKLINKARLMLENKQKTVEKVFFVHSGDTKEEHKSGMVCSGTQTYALVPLSSEHKKLIKDIIDSYEKVKPAILEINKDGMSVTFTSKSDFYDGSPLYIIRINRQGINVNTKKAIDELTYFYEDEKTWFFKEVIGLRHRLYIVGGGHVALALSRIMRTLDFYITVLDNRRDLDTMKKNTYADEKIVISYDEIESYIPEGKHIYVAIMTFGHKFDEQVLEKLITKNVKYIGLMASKTKKEILFQNLEKKGIARELLENKVHSPIGISINSVTPEEIAISIAAEIIAVKNAGLKK